MPERSRLVEVLKMELRFLEQGGYRKGLRHPWRPNFVFEDSPTCLNFGKQGEEGSDLRPCGECLLMDFVPPDRRDKKFPCRHIHLTERGESVNSFYEWGTEEELEIALGRWLRRKIQELESLDKAGSKSAD